MTDRIRIEFDPKSYQRDATITIPGVGTYDRGDVHLDTDSLTPEQRETLAQIYSHGVRIYLNEEGTLEAEPAVEPQINHCNMGHQVAQDVRRLPTGGGGADILCYACYRREITDRIERNKELQPGDQFETPAWQDLEVYTGRLS